MDFLQLLVMAVIGLVGGTLSGLVGVGGGIVFVPGLVYGAGWQIQEAVAASLMIIVFSSLSGTLRNAKSADPVNWRVAGLLALTVAPSSLIGVYISTISPEAVVQVSFAALLIALAYPTARKPQYGENQKKIPVPLVFVAGIFIGTLSGLVGVGGGVLMVPLMVLGLGLTTKRAVSTSLAVVLFTGLIGATGYVFAGFRDPAQLLSLIPLIVCSMIGAWAGVRIRDRLPENTIRTGFAVFMVIVALRIFSEALGIF